VIGEIKHQLSAQGAEGALMTGSGTTVFGLFADEASAENAYSTLARNRNWRLFLADLLV
jgi:4-diphosphocytidyl-2-C-methyl-D-erythritol kinase